MPDVRVSSPTDLSQARIAELLKALTSGPIGDAILGLTRGEKQIVLRPYRAGSFGPMDGYVAAIEDVASPSRGRSVFRCGMRVRADGVEGLVESVDGDSLRIRDTEGRHWRVSFARAETIPD